MTIRDCNLIGQTFHSGEFDTIQNQIQIIFASFKISYNSSISYIIKIVISFIQFLKC